MRRADAAGFTLIEVLVAVVLLSIGLLGLASVQTVSLQRGSSAAQRVEATNLAYDLLDRMRANRRPAILGNYAIEYGETATGTSIADLDLIAWKAAIAAALPNGDGRVRMTNQTADITVIWDDASNANPGGLLQGTVTLRTQL